MEFTQRKLNRSDLLGAAASGLCAIHCTLTPLLFAAKPILEGTMGEQAHGVGFWAVFDYVFLVLSLAAVWYSARHTSHSTIKWVLWIAWIVFAIGILSEPLELAYGKWLMYIGSITLVVAHLQNYRYCRSREDAVC